MTLPSVTENFAPAWDHFWQHTHAAHAARGSGAQDPALKQFWTGTLSRYLAPGETSKSFLDLGSGDGAVTGFALQAAGQSVDCHALDYSASALLELRQRYSGCRCVAADAARAPYPEGSFDLVGSQFGVEYAGTDAILDAGRLVAPGGVLILLIHMHGGAIYKECKQSLRAISDIQRSQLLPAARRAFEAGFEIAAGAPETTDHRAAGGAFTASVRRLEQILARMGGDVAGGLVRQIHADLRQMYSNLRAYEPQEVYDWTTRMLVELEAFGDRMTSMTQAAMDAKAFRSLVSRISTRGLKPRINRELRLRGTGRAGAWTLLLERT